jgi:hypothetical protein
MPTSATRVSPHALYLLVGPASWTVADPAGRRSARRSRRGRGGIVGAGAWEPVGGSERGALIGEVPASSLPCGGSLMAPRITLDESPGRGPDAVCAAGTAPRALYRSLIFLRQPRGHGGNPPPRRDAPHDPLPPSASLSRNDQEKVNVRKHMATSATSTRPGRPRALHQSLTFLRQARGHGGNPPPRREGRRGPLPPSATLSRNGQGNVNARRETLASPTSIRPCSAGLPLGGGTDLLAGAAR